MHRKLTKEEQVIYDKYNKTHEIWTKDYIEWLCKMSNEGKCIYHYICDTRCELYFWLGDRFRGCYDWIHVVNEHVCECLKTEKI